MFIEYAYMEDKSKQVKIFKYLESIIQNNEKEDRQINQ